LRRAGQSIWPIASSNEAMRPSTDARPSNAPTELLSRNGAEVQRLMSDAGRV
jgi:hypothetical protein